MLLAGPWPVSAGSGESSPEKKPAAPKEVVATRLDTAPVLDGSLDEAAWSQPPLALGDWLSYNPMPGERITQKTDVWVGYDDRYLYVAFRCSDPEPGKIKTGDPAPRPPLQRRLGGTLASTRSATARRRTTCS